MISPLSFPLHGQFTWKGTWPILILLCLGACSDDSNNETASFPYLLDQGSQGTGSPDGKILTGTDGETNDAINQEDTTLPESCDQDAPCPPGLFCVVSPSGNQCAEDCLDLCPATGTCTPTDGLLVCTENLDPAATLCKPCYTDEDCGGGDEGNICVEYGPAGRFCGGPCNASEPCPDGYGCTPQQRNGEVVETCVLLTGVCECSEQAIAESASTPCYTLADGENCQGVRYCTEGGLTPCNVGVGEFCDGVDNDCDGDTDEDLLGCEENPNPDADEDGDGVTVGQGDCNDLNDEIKPGIPDICDGINNDCDDQVDENGDGDSCTLQNEWGICAGMALCEDGVPVCEGPSANECGMCAPLPDLYGTPCGCTGVIGCDGTCEGDSPNPCVPTSCFVGTNGTQGSVGCPETCSTCPQAPWRVCFCSSGVGEASLSMEPSSLTVGESLTVAVWSPVPLENPALLVNGIICLGAPSPNPCEDPDDCGGLLYTWEQADTSLFQLGTNQLEIIENTNGASCEDNADTVLLKGYVPMTF